MISLTPIKKKHQQECHKKRLIVQRSVFSLFVVFQALASRAHSSHHAYLIERVDFQGESVHTRHATDRMEIRQLGGKVGLKGHIVEVLIRYFGLTAVLEF